LGCWWRGEAWSPAGSRPGVLGGEGGVVCRSGAGSGGVLGLPVMRGAAVDGVRAGVRRDGRCARASFRPDPGAACRNGREWRWTRASGL